MSQAIGTRQMTDMTGQTASEHTRTKPWLPLLALACAAAAWFWPVPTWDTLVFVFRGMIEVAPLAVPGVLISAWVNASGAGGRIASAFAGNRVTAIVFASLIGAVTPVCGITVLPLMAGLLSSGVPLAPVMAFWLSSPVTDPAMFAVTAATLGVWFAIGKSVAAFGIGVLGGAVTATLPAMPWIRSPLRTTGLAATLRQDSCNAPAQLNFAIWNDAERRQRFRAEISAMSRLLAICLGFAFAAEHVMQMFLQPEALAPWVGAQTNWAIPLAVFVGAPAYIDGYAALPLTRGLIDHGMAEGAAMAFLVSGSVVSIWGAMAIFPVLKLKAFLFYLALAIAGSLATGWIYALTV